MSMTGTALAQFVNEKREQPMYMGQKEQMAYSHRKNWMY